MSAKKKKNSLNMSMASASHNTDDLAYDDLAMSDDEEGGTRIGDIYIPPPIPPHCSAESKGPRLIITNIVIENFKSYAGQIDLGPFHPCSSAVIGPNGSGKSNVIDAMLFVFGYRAQKLRSKKLSVLMHNSTRNPNNNSCTVYVHFKEIIDKPNDEFEDVPNSEFVISRTAFKDNASFYSIDSKKVQFKEVAKLLRQHHVDLDHNRFLILQGEVESIAMMKPKGANDNECGLLEYLEDIIGTSRYIAPLVKINDKVELLNEERTEKHNRCKLSEREMMDLEQPMKEAIEYLKNENQITKTKNLLYQKYLNDLNCQLKDLDLEFEEVNKELTDHDEIFEKIKNERIQKELIIKEEIDKYENLIKDKDDTEQKLREAANKYAEIQTSLKATNKRRKDAKVQIDKEQHKLIELKQIPEKNKADIEKCERTVAKLTKDKVELDEILVRNLSTLKDETKDLIVEKERYQTKLIDLQKIVDESKAELTIAESELKMCKYNETTESRKLLTLTHALEDLKESHTEKAQQLRKNKEIVVQLKPKLEESQKNLKSYEIEEAELSRKLLEFNAEIQESVSNMQASKSNNKVLNALMDQKQKGLLPGILGRLGDLGGIDSKYDVAISTCCGRLDNIVVDTVNTAQLCIEFLKKNDIGRATFVALEKVMHLQSKCNTRIQTPENVPRIFDLIRVEDQRVRPAFYFSLYDTLVSNDLEQGTRIAYGARRYRVVTLNGDLIETSGTMSGGGKTLLRGKMGQNVQTKTNQNAAANTSYKSIENLQVQAQKMREQINYLQEQQSTLEPEINQMISTLRSTENDIRKLIIDLKSITDQLPRLEETILKQEEKRNECKTDEKKVKSLENIIENKKEIFDKSKIEADKIHIEADKITKQINQITESKVKDVKKKINDLNKQIEKSMTVISHLTVEITSSERNVKKTEDKIENLNAEIIRAQDTIKTDCELRDNYDKETELKTAKIEEIDKEIKLAQTNSSSVKKEITIIQKQENDGKLKRFELVLAVQEVEKKISGVKEQMPRWKNSLRPLELHEIPNSEPEEPLKVYTDEELKSYKIQDLQYQFSVAEQNLNAKKPNLSVINDYQKKHEKYLERVALLEDITTKRNEMRQLYDDVRKKRYNEFMQGYAIISKKVKEMYRTITFGGDAELELVDSMDPFIEGIAFSVRPPKKSWKMISNLSGGEKTLSSLALVFALHYYKPSPLYVMDEIDAALDFKNVTIVANYIKERAKNAQFIIISLRSNMFEVCDILVGIYKVYDCSSSVAIKNIIPVFNNINEPKISISAPITLTTDDNIPAATTTTDEQSVLTADEQLMQISDEQIIPISQVQEKTIDDVLESAPMEISLVNENEVDESHTTLENKNQSNAELSLVE